MLITEYNRYNATIFPVIETQRFLIIDGKTYDKRSLALLNSEPIEIGVHNTTGTLPKEVLCTKFAVLGDPAAAGMSQWTYQLTEGVAFINEYDEAERVCSVTDIDDENIEWTIIGDRVLKYNVETMKCEVIAPFNALGADVAGRATTNTMFLHQDSDYIYFVGGRYNSYSYRHRFSAFNKKTLQMTFADAADTNPTIPGAASRNGYGMFRIIGRKDGIIIYATNSFQNSIIYTFRAICSAGKVTVSAEKMMWTNATPKALTANAVTNCMTFMSNIDKYGWVYYPDYLNSSTKIADKKHFLVAAKYNTKDLVPGSASEQKFDVLAAENRDDIAKEFLRNYFKKQPDEELTDDEWAQGLWLAGIANAMYQVHIAGENDEFLVVVWLNPTNIANVANNFNYSKMIVFKRNNPETDPFDLTMTDLVMFKDLDVKSYYTSFYKEATNRYIAVSANKLTYFTISNQGKVTYKNLVRPNVITWGMDEYRRLYYIDKTLKPQTFTDTQPYYLETEYKDPSDSYFEYSNQPVTKTMVVKLANIKKEPVGGVVSLSISGSGEFADSGSNLLRVTVPKTGSVDVDVIINSIGTVAISAKIIYNNELAITGV